MEGTFSYRRVTTKMQRWTKGSLFQRSLGQGAVQISLIDADFIRKLAEEGDHERGSLRCDRAAMLGLHSLS